MILETKRLILRPWKESDAEDLYRYAKDPAVGPIAGWPPHSSVENSREIICDILSAPNTFAVELRSTGEVVGSIGLLTQKETDFEDNARDVEIGYWLGVPYWGKGLIPEAVREIQRYCFEECGYHTIWCVCYEGNERSKRVQEKCGFQYHHTERDKPCIWMNDIRTEEFRCLTKKQWNCIRAAQE